jgi:hypothetical protein
MRLSAVILLPFLFALPATVPARAETPAPATAPAAHHARVTWQKRFEQANTSHDGHLTLEQARTGYKTVARHFMEIDVAGHGYVTEDDVRAWHKQRHAAQHHLSSAGDRLPPWYASGPVPPQARVYRTSATGTVSLPAEAAGRP